MQELTDHLTEMLLETEEQLKKVRKILKNAPPGRLRIIHADGRAEYHLVLDGKDRYLKKEEEDLARDLAEKAYCLRLEKRLEAERKCIRQFLNAFDPEAGKRVFEVMGQARKKLVSPVVIPDESFRESWLRDYQTAAEEDPNRQPFVNEFSTERGEIVRSKSEQIIADKLFYRNIPYVYEVPLRIGNQKVYPDFTVLNVRTRKTYYWEHFGRMDDPSYTERMTRKLMIYESAGIWPGDGLLSSYETSQQPLNTRLLDEMIRKYLM